jgi:hypothetical protein
MPNSWEWDDLTKTVPWKINGRRPDLYERNRIRLPYMVVHNPTSREFFYLNRDDKQLGVRKEECRFQAYPPMHGTRHYFYDEKSAPRTQRTTKRLLCIIRSYEEEHLAGFTERTDFGPLTGPL